ncbi:MAG: DUF1858 domain-containing protein [Bacteroidota bacterium]|nr:MAG: DUF1858 domain-containing protein [Bacteroidota bacterium]
MEKLIITPKTKIFDLLEAYPQLEDVLISHAPEFKKLKNPILRKTIARVASISQAAVIGGLNVEELVNKLRAEVGQDNIHSLDESGNKYTTVCPDWFKKELIVKTIDIREMLNRDEQPVHEVLAAAKNLQENEILKIIAPFIPAPLLDKSLSLDYKHWLDKKGDEEYWVFFKA